MKFYGLEHAAEPSLSVNRFFPKEESEFDGKCQGDCCREVEENGTPNESRISEAER